MSAFPDWQESSASTLPPPPPLGELMRQGAEGGWRDGRVKGVKGWRGRKNRGLVTHSLLGSTQREHLGPIQNTALAPWRRPGCHTHTHSLVHPNSSLVDPACQARHVGIFISRENSLSSLLLSCMPEGSEREQTDIQHHTSVCMLLVDRLL